MIIFKILPTNTTIMAEFYCNQLNRFAVNPAEASASWPVRFLHGNSRLHTAACTRLKSLDFDTYHIVQTCRLSTFIYSCP